MMTSTISSGMPLVGINVCLNRFAKASPDYSVPSVFKVGVNTPVFGVGDTDMGGSEVDITSGVDSKDLNSVVLDEVNGNVVFKAWLSITEANGNLLDGLGVFNGDDTLITKATFDGVSKTDTELFKFSVKIKGRNKEE